jgi:hypothetical protein
MTLLDILCEIEIRLDRTDPNRTAIDDWIQKQPPWVEQAAAQWQQQYKSGDLDAIAVLDAARISVAWHRMTLPYPRLLVSKALYLYASRKPEIRHPVTDTWVGTARRLEPCREGNLSGGGAGRAENVIEVAVEDGATDGDAGLEGASPGDGFHDGKLDENSMPKGTVKTPESRGEKARSLTASERQRRYRQRHRSRSIDVSDETLNLLNRLCSERRQTIDQALREMLNAALIEGITI